ncbi:zinc finger protein ZAT5 [Cynara cardunculus var. scolymus]|uniref:Zinc finger, C2H2 n=1 Tax=Cynara cardunculus var. scolymus TaxID=59895 RepID=A0A118K5V2_CYNCS|nr:zinc finger protein ZAT5 [Cynara cardunculus var. scolymus]KVI09676.1 Zinc finger, C2H2 [Cynara cardunculus var. scolymus]
MEPDVADQTTTAGGGISGDDGGPTNIVKGKRTKRQRLQSSIPFTIVPQSSTSNNPFNSSPASSSDFPAGSTTTEEEDTAKCLILLSKGHNVSLRNINNDDQFSGYKFNSKRYIQTSTDTVDGFTGIYVYECKTCSRTFPSFQALGGHRASHKKPRINEEKRRPPPYTVFSDEDEPSLQFPSRKNNSSSSSSLSLQLNHRVSSTGNTKKSSSKLHECSICGTEFNSGQALGGHMRRHRVANCTTTTSAAATTTNTTLSLVPYSPITPMVADDQDNYQKSRNDGLCLDLDLNLPAPPEASSNQDHRRESSFTFTANPTKQQSAVHLSAAPTLVDCHY